MSENLPTISSTDDVNESFWQQRFEQINQFEKTQVETGTRIIKFMLNVSQHEQHKRFLDRLEEPENNWKFNASDWKESELWDEYQSAYQDMLTHTHTDHAPWYVIPCDDKPSARIIMGNIILDTLDAMNPQFPEMSEKDREASGPIHEMLKKEFNK